MSRPYLKTYQKPINPMNARVLVIDDNPQRQAELQHLLTSLGYQVVIATDAVEGLGIAFTSQPDLIILNTWLPGMDAGETCLCFRKISDVLIMLLTVEGTEAERIKALTLGADAYLVRPVSLGELVARIRALLRRAPRQGGAP